MKIVFKNIVRSVKGHPKENLLILVNIILCTMTVFILLQNYYYLKNHFDITYSNDEIASHYSIQMSDKDFQSMLSDIMNKSPMYFIGQKVNSDIMNTPNLSLYRVSSSRVPLNVFVNKNLMAKYARRDDSLYESFQMDGEQFDESECYFIEAIITTENVDKVFNLRLLEGRFFESKDRNTNNPDMPVPVVLGNDFADKFEVGEIIEMNNDKVEVIGIMEDNMYMNLWGFVEYMDDKIITICPVFPRIFDLSIEDYNYKKNEIYTCVYCDNKTLDVQKEINRITAENGYYTYEVQPIDGVEISETKSVSTKNVALIGFLALIACIICTCSLTTVLMNRTIQDSTIYCIYLCYGIPVWKINLSITIEMLFFLCISILPTYAVSMREFKGVLISGWQILLFSAISVLVSLIPIFRIIGECNLDMMMRNKIV